MMMRPVAPLARGGRTLSGLASRGTFGLEAQSAPRYMGIPTFMRTPLISVEQACTPSGGESNGLDVALLGVPFDGGVTNRPGARHGPRDVRVQSANMRGIHRVHNFSPFEIARVGDVGDVPIENVFGNCGPAHAEITEFVRPLFEAGILPISCGGDHSVLLPLVKAARSIQSEPLSLIHIDAHTDTWDEIWGEDDHHGAPVRRAVEQGLVDPKRTVMIGIRGAQMVTDGWDYCRDMGITVLWMETVAEIGIDATIKQARAIVGEDTPTYLTFDIDSIDPIFAPGTGTPECGGLTTREAMQLLRGMRGLDLVGCDMVEVSPPFDSSTNTTALVGATVMYELLCLLADKQQKRRAAAAGL